MEQNWIKVLNEDDKELIRRFILASGSLKDLAAYYNVTYPTIRSRIDRLIEKIKLSESNDDPCVAYVKSMALEGKITVESAKELIDVFRENMEV